MIEEPHKAKGRSTRRPTDVTEIAPLQLGFWPDAVRGVPNAALRGALFSISQERGMAKKRQRLATVDGYQVTFKGERFNQSDLDLWEMLYIDIYRTSESEILRAEIRTHCLF